MTARSDFKARHPLCCFCGGTTATAEVDHQPARIIFPNKHRPKGMEYPSCSICNRQTSGSEALLALLSRVTGGFRPRAQKDFNRFNDILVAIRLKFPGLLNRIHQGVWVKQKGIYQRSIALDVGVPEIKLEMNRIAAKLCLAQYYSRFGRPAVAGCRINTQWTHVQNVATGESVQRLISAIPFQNILQQGNWRTDETFYIKSHYENGQLFTLAIFHELIAHIAILTEPGVQASTPVWQYIMSPTPGAGIIPVDLK